MIGPQKPKETWELVVEGLVKRCELASAFNQQVVIPPHAAKVLGRLLTNMAKKLDAAEAQGKAMSINPWPFPPAPDERPEHVEPVSEETNPAKPSGD